MAGFHHPSSPSLLLWCCRCSWDVALAAATAEAVERWKVTWHFTSMGALVDPLSQPGTSVSCWKQCDCKPRRQTQIQSQPLCNCHPQRPLSKCNRVYSSSRLWEYLLWFTSDRNWLLNPPQGQVGFCFVLFPWIVCFIYTALRDIIYHILKSPPN